VARVTQIGGLRVLVVEDEMLVSLLIEDMLTDHGCCIVGPFDRVGLALEAVGKEQIDCAVLDVNVAGDKIYPVAEALTERQIPFIFLSGYGQNAVPAGRTEWQVCTKPFTSDQLLSALCRRLERDN
jgi:two-component SAPR family response regulator